MEIGRVWWRFGSESIHLSRSDTMKVSVVLEVFNQAVVGLRHLTEKGEILQEALTMARFKEVFKV